MMPLQDSIPAPHTQLVINSTELHFLMCTKQRTRHIVSPKCKVTVHTDMSTSFTKGNFDIKTKRYVYKRLSPSHLDIHHESALQFVLSMDGMNNDFTRFLYWTEFMTLKCVSKDVKLQLSRIVSLTKCVQHRFLWLKVQWLHCRQMLISQTWIGWCWPGSGPVPQFEQSMRHCDMMSISRLENVCEWGISIIWFNLQKTQIFNAGRLHDVALGIAPIACVM